ncbi:MAG TPA: cytochrome P450 [Polyangiaceae bacterium]|nr:cytochrome P450 [Polyangiaceae bacterium]
MSVDTAPTAVAEAPAPVDTPTLPRSSWFGGHLGLLAGDNIPFFERCEREFPIVKLRVYHVPVFVVSDPNLIGEVLLTQRKNFEKPRSLKMLRRLFGQGLLTANYDVWQRQQSIMRPMFQPTQVRTYGPSMSQCLANMIDEWKDGEERDILADMTTLTLRMACSTIFGPDAYEAREAVLEVTEAAQAFFMEWRVDFLPLPEYRPTRATWRYHRSIARLDKVVYDLVDKRQAKPTGDILSQLVHSRDERGEPMSRRQVRDEAVTLFLGAHETSAAAAAWGLSYITTRPEVHDRIEREVDATVGQELVNAEALKKLPYLAAVIKEVLRLRPSIPVISRQAISACSIGGHMLPKGAQVLMTSWALHRSTRYYSDPEAFMPERWTPEFEKTLPRWAYFPFGGGHRVCIGQHMAFQELGLILATTLQRVFLDRTTLSAPRPSVGLTMAPKKGSVRLMVCKKAPLPLSTRAFPD